MGRVGSTDKIKSLEETTDTETMEKIKTKALRYFD